jgi:hypothetical protein
MMRRLIARIAQMDSGEIMWRSQTAARNAVDRVRSFVFPPRWRRRDLTGRLAPLRELTAARQALAAGHWDAAHAALSHHFACRPQRFPVAASSRAAVAERIRREFPRAPADAAARASRIVDGRYDLLGYHGLRFDTPGGGAPDWAYDPVHDRRAPHVYWSRVPYLDAACGDHKIIWELNRHQHWLALGRAYWLTDQDSYRNVFLRELASWIDTNPPFVGINWASMLELGLRSISWLWALHFFVEDTSGDAQPWLVDLLLALDRQLRHIERHLSYYFSPNTHLLGEALALYVAGRALPELARSPRYEAVGRKILLDEFAKQVAADGGHCERAAHYHKYTLDFCLFALAVARITDDRAAGAFQEVAGRLAFAARLLADDRGRLPHLGDDDGGSLTPIAGCAADDVRDSLAVAAALVGRADLRIGPPPEEAFWLLAHPRLAAALEESGAAPAAANLGSAALPATGYYVSRSRTGDHLVIDGGPLGYRNAGHAHADLLSVTFVRHGVPLLIDPGTGCYTVDAGWRDRFRSTAFHNTITIDGRPQAVPRGPFHWEQTRDASVRRWRANSGFDYFDGEHDSYRPLTHRRRVLALHDDLLVVADLVGGTGSHAATAHWHIDPRWHVEFRGRRARLMTEGERVDLVTASAAVDALSGDEETGLGWHSPVYGRIEPATTIRISRQAAAPFWLATVFGLDVDNEVADVDLIPVWAEAGLLEQAVAIRVARAASVDHIVIAEPAATSAEPATWRVGEIETDARMLFCRTDLSRQMTRLALVDGSMVRIARRGLHLVLPRPTADLHLDVTGFTPEAAIVHARMSGPVFGARLLVAGQEQPIEMERRVAPRLHHH